VIRKDPATGEPNGVIEEAGSLVSRHIPARSKEQPVPKRLNGAIGITLQKE